MKFSHDSFYNLHPSSVKRAYYLKIYVKYLRFNAATDFGKMYSLDIMSQYDYKEMINYNIELSPSSS